MLGKIFESSVVELRWSYYYNHPFLKRFLGVLSVDILVKGLAFLLIPVYLRLMTQEEYGLYNYLFSIIQTFSLVLNLGLYIPQSKLYHTVGNSKEKGELLFTIFTTLLVFLSVLAVPMVLFNWDFWVIDILFRNSFTYSNFRAIVLFSLLISILSFMLTNFFYTSEKIKQVKAYNVCRIIFLNLLTVLALYILHENSVKIRFGIANAVEGLLLLFFGYSFFKDLSFHFNWRLMRASLRMGLPIMLSASFGIIINFSDKFFLEKYGTLSNLSSYYLSFSFASIIPLLFSSFQNVWLPIFLKERNAGENFRKSKKIIFKLLIFFIIISISIWSLFFILNKVAIIPEKYNSALWVLPILLATQIVTALTSIFSNYLVYFEKTNIVSIVGFLVCFISIGFSLWLVPKWGAVGAAVASLAVNTVYLIIYYYLIIYLKRKYIEHSVIKMDK